MEIRCAVIMGLLLVIVLPQDGLSAEKYPELGEGYWKAERDNAQGKIWRGVALGVTGVAAVVPTTLFAYKATDDPQKWLALSIASGIACLGMTFHGFNSIGWGKAQRDTANDFLDQYARDPSSVSRSEEEHYYLRSEKKSTRKTIIFGGTLVLQSAIFLANGIVLTVRKRRGVDIGNLKIWPWYLLAGLFLPGGTALIIARSIRYRALNELGSSSTSTTGSSTGASALTLKPLLQIDAHTGAYSIGMSGQISF